MPPANKAVSIVSRLMKYRVNYVWRYHTLDEAKALALIAVDEILKIGWNLPHYDNADGLEYWEAVRTEITKL